MVNQASRMLAALFLMTAHTTSYAAGNSTSYSLGSVRNWTVTQVDAYPSERANIPDSLHIRGRSNRKGIAVELLCLTRNVDSTVPNFGFELFRGGVQTEERFRLTVTNGRESVALSMVTLPQDHSSTIRLASADFDTLFQILSTNGNVDLSFSSASGQLIAAQVHGASQIRALRPQCENLTS